MTSMTGLKILTITVSDPQKEGNGFYAKTTYAVKLIANKMDLSGCEVHYLSRRRYQEFSSLYKDIKKTIPLKSEFPPKRVMNKFEEKTIVERVNSFQSILNEILTYPTIINNTSFKAFLGVPSTIELYYSSNSIITIPNYHPSASVIIQYSPIKEIIENTNNVNQDSLTTSPSFTTSFQSLSLPSSMIQYKFSTIFKNVEISALFTKFLKSEHNLEPYEFLQYLYQIKHLKKILTVEMVDKEIIDTFIKSGSLKEINLNYQDKCKVLSQWANLKEECKNNNILEWDGQLELVFNDVNTIVKLQLKNDSFSRFVYKWQPFKEFLGSKNDEFLYSIIKKSSKSGFTL